MVNYARWNRSLVLSLLHRGGDENGDKAFNLLTKAKAVVDAPGGADAYPDEEGEWLVSTAWGEGTEHLRCVVWGCRADRPGTSGTPRASAGVCWPFRCVCRFRRRISTAKR